MKTALAALALLSATVVSPLLGQGDNEVARRTLVGLKSIAVVVEALGDDAERDGLERGQIQTDVELKLRQAGIVVIAEDSIKPSSGILHVSVNPLKHPRGLYAFNVELSLIQGARLARNASVATLATTWIIGRVGIVGVETFSSYVREVVRDQTDRFINSYLAANPKR
jgi:hypothetical protein